MIRLFQNVCVIYIFCFLSCFSEDMTDSLDEIEWSYGLIDFVNNPITKEVNMLV